MALNTRRLARSVKSRPQPPVNTGIIVTDTFTRTLSGSLGAADTRQPWQIANGQWSVDGAKAQLSSGASSGGQALLNCSIADAAVCLDFAGLGAGV